MQRIFARTAIIGVVGTAILVPFIYTQATRSVSADSGTDGKLHNNHNKETFGLPSTMLFSKRLTVTAVEQMNHDTKRITFALPGGLEESSGVPISGSVLTQHTPQGKWIPCLRPYSPTHDRSKPGVLELVVKKYEGGVASTHLHSLDVGETLDFRGPLPGYEWKSSSNSNSEGEGEVKAREVVLIAGGAGITPLYSLVRGVLADDPSARLHLIWGVNGTRDIIFKRELESLQARHPGRLQITYAVSGSPDQLELELEAGSSTSTTTTQGGVTATYRSGHVSKRLIQSVVESIDPAVFGDVKGTKVFFCGPPKMEEAIAGKKTGTLGQLGIESKALYKF